MAHFDLNTSIGTALGLIRKVDAFINATEPFKLAKDESKREKLGAILYQCVESLRIASLLLWCVIPDKMEEFWKALNIEVEPTQGCMFSLAEWGGQQAGNKGRKGSTLPKSGA